MSFNRYYQSELIALRELGKEFAERNPSLASFFDTPGRDPDVERILEGFAFLSGRLRQKLDDELPEITHALFNLLWPHYLRQIPASSILQFAPVDNVSGPLIMPRGTVMESIPVDDGTPCTFTTVYDTEILPIKLAGQKCITREGQNILVLSFKTLGSPLENIEFDKIRLFLTGEKAVAHTIFYYLLRKVKAVNVVLPVNHKDGRTEHLMASLGPDRIRQVGFKKEEALIPYPANAYIGYRLLQEYFCFPDKFLFVDVEGIGAGLNKAKLAGVSNDDCFELHFLLEELPDNHEAFRVSNFQLSCSPVVNIFPKSSTPLTLDYRQTEYRIVPDPRHPYHFSVYSVESVHSWGHDSKKEKEYLQFESFDHAVAADTNASYYRLRVRPAMKDESLETYISIMQDRDGQMPAHSETISMELLCTNRLLPAKLTVGQINTPTDITPESVTFKNITPVSPPYMPPLEKGVLWRLISNMSLNYIPLTNIQALRGLLATYDFKAMQDTRRAKVLRKVLSGILRVDCQETDRIYRGMPLRGAVTKLTMNKNNFACEGDMYLFASVLNEFFAMYATINSFHQLHVVEEKTGEYYQWPARLGDQLL